MVATGFLMICIGLLIVRLCPGPNEFERLFNTYELRDYPGAVAGVLITLAGCAIAAAGLTVLFWKWLP